MTYLGQQRIQYLATADQYASKFIITFSPEKDQI